jgi:LPS-assembly lipoprotein
MTSPLRLFGRLIALLPLMLIGGCGFTPLYGSGQDSAMSKLPDIFVSRIGDRYGQELRLALQQRLAGTSDAQPDGYTLDVFPSQSGEAIGIHGDNTSERTRVIGRAHWVLSTVSTAPTVVASGDASAVDGYTVINEEYFAASIAADSTQQRLADTLAGTITTQIATWFSNHHAPATASHSALPTLTLAPTNVPGNSDVSPLTRTGADGLPASATGR